MLAQPDEGHANRTASVLEWYDKHKVYNIWFKQSILVFPKNTQNNQQHYKYDRYQLGSTVV